MSPFKAIQTSLNVTVGGFNFAKSIKLIMAPSGHGNGRTICVAWTGIPFSAPTKRCTSNSTNIILLREGMNLELRLLVSFTKKIIRKKYWFVFALTFKEGVGNDVIKYGVFCEATVFHPFLYGANSHRRDVTIHISNFHLWIQNSCGCNNNVLFLCSFFLSNPANTWWGATPSLEVGFRMKFSRTISMTEGFKGVK